MPTSNTITNVEKKLHVDGGPDLGGDTPKKSLRGAAGGVYVGPVRPNSASHITGSEAGGAEDSTGFRESDTYDASGGTGRVTGSSDGTVTTNVRPTGRTAGLADGVQGGSTPGRPISSGNHVLAGGGYGGGRDRKSVV